MEGLSSVYYIYYSCKKTLFQSALEILSGETETTNIQNGESE